MKTAHAFFFAFVIIVTVNITATEERQNHYKIIDLARSNHEYERTLVLALSEDNVLYGVHFTNFIQYNNIFFSWDEKNGFQDIGILSEEFIDLLRMNIYGEAIGVYHHPDEFWPTEVVYWNPSEGKRNIFNQKSFCTLIASNINNKGEVLLLRGEDGRPSKALINTKLYHWQKDSGLIEIQIPKKIEDYEIGGLEDLSFLQITDNSEVVGYIDSHGDTPEQGIRWNKDAGFTRISPPPGYDNFVPQKISSSGYIFGYTGNSISRNAYFILDENNNYSPTSKSFLDNGVYAINSVGDAVVSHSGEIYLSNIMNGGLINLPTTPHFFLWNSILINNNRFIACTSLVFSCLNQGFPHPIIWRLIQEEEYANMMRGDVNSDDSINLTDAVTILNSLFKGECFPCPDSGDVNDDGALNLTDAIYLLHYLFSGGSPPIGDPLSCSSE